MPAISENLVPKETRKEDVGLEHDLPSHSEQNQIADEATKVYGAKEGKREMVEVEHEKTKLEPEVDEVQHEIVKDEHETDHAQHETEQTQHESKNTEHELDQLKHESDQVEHDVHQTQHESELEEPEMITTLDEKEKLVHKHVDDEEMSIFKNERSCCKLEEVAAENMLNKAEGNEDVLNSSCIKSSTIITDALEKGMDNIHIKETAPEIQVRVT